MTAALLQSAGQRVIGYVGRRRTGRADPRGRRAAGASARRSRCADAARRIGFIERAFTARDARRSRSSGCTGALDFLDAVVLPRSDDSAQRLYYYLCELQRARAMRRAGPLIHDVASIAPPVSFEHTHCRDDIGWQLGDRHATENAASAADRSDERAANCSRRLASASRGGQPPRIARRVSLRVFVRMPSLEMVEVRTWLDDGRDTLGPATRRVLLVGNSAAG